MANDECHLFRRAERGRNDQIALALPVVVVGNDDEFAVGKGLQNFLDGIGHFFQNLAGCTKCISRTQSSAPASIGRASPAGMTETQCYHQAEKRKIIDDVRSQSPWSPAQKQEAAVGEET